MTSNNATTEELIAHFSSWMARAELSEENDPNAMSVASVGYDENGVPVPSLRMVLLKAFDEEGFVFYTNFESRKGTEIQATPNVALNIYWKSLRKQVRIVGVAQRVSDDEADAYFATRPYDSKCGAHASDQSRPLNSYKELVMRAAAISAKYRTKVPRPAHWSGFRVVPNLIEFWSAHEFKLHDRTEYVRVAGTEDWIGTRLCP